MQLDVLRAKGRRRFRVTTDVRHTHAIAPNVLARQFAVASIPERDRVWESDCTDLATGEGWLYLAVVRGLASRCVIGWAICPTMEQALTLDALTMALRKR